MTGSSRNARTIAALCGVLTVGAVAAVTAVAAQAPADRGAIVRQFRMNFSNQQVEKNGTMVADDVVVNVNGGAGVKPNGATHRGRAAFVAWQKGVKATFPGSTITEDDIVVSGNTVAVRYTVRGTQRGPLPTPDGTIPPTGRPVTMHAAEFFTFNDAGKVVRLENFSNDPALVHQLTAK